MSEKRGKYGVAPKADRTLDGVVFDSKLEMNYYKHLVLLMKAKDPKERVISIGLQVEFPIFIRGKKVFSYMLDFRVDYADRRIEYVDVKGIRTQIFILKKKCVEAEYGIKIKEIKKGQF